MFGKFSIYRVNLRRNGGNNRRLRKRVILWKVLFISKGIYIYIIWMIDRY